MTRLDAAPRRVRAHRLVGRTGSRHVAGGGLDGDRHRLRLLDQRIARRRVRQRADRGGCGRQRPVIFLVVIMIARLGEADRGGAPGETSGLRDKRGPHRNRARRGATDFRSRLAERLGRPAASAIPARSGAGACCARRDRQRATQKSRPVRRSGTSPRSPRIRSSGKAARARRVARRIERAPARREARRSGERGSPRRGAPSRDRRRMSRGRSVVRPQRRRPDRTSLEQRTSIRTAARSSAGTASVPSRRRTAQLLAARAKAERGRPWARCVDRHGVGHACRRRR